MIVVGFPHKGLWTPDELAALHSGYSEGAGVEAIAFAVGRSNGAVRNKAYELGITKNAEWSERETAALKRAYTADALGIIDADAIAAELGRSKASVYLKASKLGLGDPCRKLVPEWKDHRKFKGDEQALTADRSARAKRMIAENGHPRGMAGKTHSPETRERLSKASSERWAGKSDAERQEWCDNLAKAKDGAPKVARGTWKAGWREISGKRNYYRSRWEANYARYLEWLKQNGEIVEWQHEPETFWFEAIKRGVRSYKPDFRVWEVGGKSILHEVKGWMDARSKTTLKRMAKYHPAETVIVIREKQYNEIARKVGPMIDGWESGGRADRP